jgi:adenylate cyclase
VNIFTPRAPSSDAAPALAGELALWGRLLVAWRSRDWDTSRLLLLQLRAASAENVLYRLYAERVASMQEKTPDARWDGTTVFEDK